MEINKLKAIIGEVLNDFDLTLPDQDIWDSVRPRLLTAVEEMRLDLKRELLTELPRPITVSIPQGNQTINRDLGLQHRQFTKLLALAAAKTADGHHLNVWLAGPAGTGKTTAAANVAKALGLKFYFNGAIDSEHKLLGFVDAHGKIVSRPFREAYEKGGVYLFDEVDASLPGALLAFNAALANGACDFPDGCAQRHPDCVIIAAANTAGHGASVEYVGRMKQDMAFLDRFVFLDWPVDELLEKRIAANLGHLAWAVSVQGFRANAKRQGIRVVISPRATYHGAALLAAGIDIEQVLQSTIRKGMDEETFNRLRN